MPDLPPSQLPVLALDTSTEQIAIGLHTDAGSFTRLAAGGALASARLLPELKALLVEARLDWGDLGAVAFGQGPGAFTGLRTACAVAQGLGFGLQLPLVPLDSLLIVAEDARAQLGVSEVELGVVMDARMDEAYAARYRWRDGRWQVLSAPALVSLSVLHAQWQDAPVQALAGSGLAAFGDRLLLPCDGPRLAREHDRAAALLRLAVRALADGAGVDAAAALPMYLRDKVAQTTAEREQARAVAGA